MNTMLRLLMISGILMATGVGVLTTLMPSAYSADLSPLTKVTISSGLILANDKGMTVYVFDKDAKGPSVCYDGCAKAWPPVLLKADATVSAPLTLQIRRDGARQLVLNGSPLYLYANDQKSTDTNGDGLGGIWHIVPAPIAPEPADEGVGN